MILEREMIDKYLWYNYREMKDPEFMFGVDNNQDTLEDFKDSDLKVLTVFLTPGKIRGYSSTVFALNTLIHKGAEGVGKVFMDYCHIPYQRTVDKLIKDEIPLLFGNVSHASWIDYDLIFLSVSTLPELVNYPPMLEYSGIPLEYEKRLEDSDIPPIIVGGASSLISFCYFGETGRGGRSLVDVAFFGYGDGIVDNLIKESIEFNKNKRIKKNKQDYFDFIKESELKEYAYFPTCYKYNYSKDDYHIESIDKLDSRVPDKVKVKIGESEFVNFSKRLFFLDGSGITRQNLNVTKGCTGKGGCSFCLEGQIGGCYKEKSIEDLIEDMNEMKRTSAVSSLGYFSYNINYYSKFIDLLKESAERFNNLSLITMRTDVMAEKPEYLKLAKRFGLTKISMAIEGMGDRVRNKLLNKNLSMKQIRQAVINVFNSKVSSLKINLIVTGYETEEDIKEWLKELDEIIEIKRKMGARTLIKLTHTSLIIYDGTPLRWMKREIAENSWYDNKTMDSYISELRKRDVKFRFHGRGPKYYFEQFLLDMGAMATEFLVKMSLEKGMRFYNDYHNLNRENLKDVLDYVGIPFDVIFRERDINEIMPSDTVQFVPEKQLNKWKDMHLKQDFRESICLKTPANLDTKCENCGYCKTVEQRENVINRDLDNQFDVDDVINSLSMQRHVESYRIVLEHNSKWEFYDRRALSMYITSLFLRESEDIFNSFYEVDKNSLWWLEINDQNIWATGKWVFDIKFRKRINISWLLNSIDKVNQKLESCKIIGIYGDVKELPLKSKDELVWMGEVKGYSMSKLKNALSNFDWEIKYAKQVIGVEMTIGREYMPELQDKLLFIPYKNNILTYMTLPVKINPYMVMGTLFNEPYKNMKRDCNFKLLEHGKPVDVSCKCGNKLHYSMINNKMESECSICKGKKLLYLIQKKG